VNLLPFNLREITDAIDLEYAIKSGADTFRHVGDQFPGKSVQSSNSPRFFSALNMNNRPINFDRNSGRNRDGQLSFGSFQPNCVTNDCDFNA